MSRLKRPVDSFFLSLQMSNYGIFVFVEGDNDRYFYAKICAQGLQSRPEKYAIYLSSEIPGDSGGKSSLLKCFTAAESLGHLASDFHGKRTGLLFFVDNDADTVVGTACASEHLIYTKYYDLENHLYAAGDLAEACAAACCLDSTLVTSAVGDEAKWRKGVAKQWKEWVFLCYFAKKHGISCGVTYGKPSNLHSGTDERLDGAAYATCIDTLKQRSGLTEAEFESRFCATFQEVDTYYVNGEWDALFKGKWYGIRLQRLMTQINQTNTSHAHVTGVNVKGDDFVRKISMMLDYRATWANHFNHSFERFLTCMA